MDALAQFLHKWQTLTGAFLGGVFALGVALLVAYVNRRREDVAAAMLVIANTVETKARFQSVKRLAEERAIPDADFHKWLSEKMVQSRPKLAPTFDAAAARLMPIDAHMAGHLAMFQMSHRELQEKIERLAEDFKDVREKGKPSRSVKSMEADAKIVSDDIARAANHAECVEALLNMLVLGRGRHWNRLVRKFKTSAEERRCLAVLKQGGN